MSKPDPATAAIGYALTLHPMNARDFLNMWFHGDFPELRQEWPDAPEDVYIGADPLHPQTKVALAKDKSEQQQITAWQAMFDALTEMVPGWLDTPDTANAQEAALATLHRLVADSQRLAAWNAAAITMPDSAKRIVIEIDRSPGLRLGETSVELTGYHGVPLSILPRYSDAEGRVNDGSASALDRFIVNHEPAGLAEESQFRAELAAVLKETTDPVASTATTRVVGDGPLGVQLDKDEVAFLAARLRRLCHHFGYPVPSNHKDDFIVGIGGSLIGGVLTKLRVAEKQLAKGDDDAEFSLSQWWYQSLLEVTRRIGTATEEDRNIHRAIIGVVPKLVSLYVAKHIPEVMTPDGFAYSPFTLKDDGWYFLDEVQEEYGPYPTQIDAAVALGGFLHAYSTNPHTKPEPDA